MSKIDYQALREAAEKALHGEWGYEAGAIWNTCDSGYVQHMAAVETGDDVSDEEHMSNMRFITLATPTVVLGLLDELSEAKAAEENESSCANSVIDIAINWQMRAKDAEAKLESAEKRIAELESGSQAQKLVEAIIVAIENEQERLFDEDYLMDSKECIDVIREEVKRWNDSRAAGIRINGGE
ncbi:ead/Ea22-like family protein [Escherichia coli]|nr:ead/Ea22-like family protein [Escherichia coli]